MTSMLKNLTHVERALFNVIYESDSLLNALSMVQAYRELKSYDSSPSPPPRPPPLEESQDELDSGRLMGSKYEERYEPSTYPFQSPVLYRRSLRIARHQSMCEQADPENGHNNTYCGVCFHCVRQDTDKFRY
nr:MAG: hypothetical protein [Cressdnaviricota sp.]